MGTDGQGRAGECASGGPGGLPRPAVTEFLGFQLACFPCPLPSVAPAGLPSERSEHLESGVARRGGRRPGGDPLFLRSSHRLAGRPPLPAANQNHSTEWEPGGAPSCSRRPPGDLTRCQASLAAQPWGYSEPMTPPTPHPRAHPSPRHHQRAIGSLQLNGTSTCCRCLFT